MASSVWEGELSQPNAAHMYIKASNSASTQSLGALAGGTSANHASIGLIEVIAHEDSTETLSFKAENSKVSIKEISGERTISYEVTALIKTDVTMSLAKGYMAGYEAAGDVTIPASRESIYGDVIIHYLKDESAWGSSTVTTSFGVRYKKCLIKPLGLADTYDGTGRQVFKFMVIPFQDNDGNLDIILDSITLDATAEYITVT
jgi:hypothetical protein